MRRINSIKKDRYKSNIFQSGVIFILEEGRMTLTTSIIKNYLKSTPVPMWETLVHHQNRNLFYFSKTYIS